jgi:diguanylate cyclase (GGDEF)-like protein/PAS domain S-box-containing protein
VGSVRTTTDIDERKSARDDLQASQREGAQLATLLDTLQSCAPIGIGFVDRDFRVVRINEMLAAFNGETVEAQLGRKLADVFPQMWPHVGPLYQQVLSSGVAITSRPITGSTAADPGRVHHWLGSYYPVSLDGDIIGVGVIVVDVTGQQDAERELRQSEARYRSIADTAREGIWTVDLAGRTQYANQRVADVLGLRLDELYSRTAPEVLDPQSSGFIAHRLLNRHRRGPEEYDLDYSHPDGVERLLHLSVSPLNDDTGGVGSLAMITDITASRRADDELRRQALHDALTGLPNRALLRDRLDHALARQRNDGGHVAVVFADLDQFKLVNDTWGHSAGDDLLEQVAGRWVATVGTADTLARFGGDEFVVVTECLDKEEVCELAERMLSALSEPLDVFGQRVYVSASIGVAISPPDTSDKLLRSADAAMYDAKARGRARISVFDAATAESTADRLALSTDLRDALAGNQLALHYQPVVDVQTGAVVGVEALLRWDHPLRGVVPPDQFVPVAEATGLAQALDEWVLERACADQVRLRGFLGADAYLSVNISAGFLNDPDLEAHVVAALGPSVAAGRGLVLEITETALMEDLPRAGDMLARLRTHGISIAIDDFGTGYSCLGYLAQLPIDTLKIDRGFVEHITDDADALAITVSIVDLAHTLGLTTVAEGVETAEQWALLRRLHCLTGQGYVWSPALPLDELEAVISALPGNRYPIREASPGPLPGSTRRPVVAGELGLGRIMRLHRDGASLTTIAAALNADGYRTEAGLRWHRASVAAAISNEVFPDLWVADAPTEMKRLTLVNTWDD